MPPNSYDSDPMHTVFVQTPYTVVVQLHTSKIYLYISSTLHGSGHPKASAHIGNRYIHKFYFWHPRRAESILCNR